MVKAIALIKRKPGLSREEFVKHYEEVHAPLILGLLTTIKRYARNHIIVPAGAEEPEFDCVTELWYDDMELVFMMKPLDDMPDEFPGIRSLTGRQQYPGRIQSNFHLTKKSLFTLLIKYGKCLN